MSTLRDLARYGLIFTPSHAVVNREPLVSAAYLKKVRTGGRAALLAARTTEHPGKPPYSGGYVATYQWDFVWPDGDFWKSGFQGQGLYISPARDLVIAGFSSGQPAPGALYYRALATSGAFGKIGRASCRERV